MKTASRSLLVFAAVALAGGCATHQKFGTEPGQRLSAREFASEYVRVTNVGLAAQAAGRCTESAETPHVRVRELFGPLATVPCDARARGDAFRPLRLVSATPPDHPTTVLHQGRVEGETWVGAEIDATGAVVRVEFLVETDERIRATVDRAMRKWRFEPAAVNDTPVAMAVVVPFAFHLARR